MKVACWKESFLERAVICAFPQGQAYTRTLCFIDCICVVKTKIAFTSVLHSMHHVPIYVRSHFSSNRVGRQSQVFKLLPGSW